MHNISPILIPVIAMLIPIVAIIGGFYSGIQNRRIKAEQQMAMMARGIPLAEIEAFLTRTMPDDVGGVQAVRDPMRSLANARRAAIVLMSVGIGLVGFFCALELVLNARPVLVGAASGLIPFAIGVGFWIDYRLQQRDMARFGLEVGSERG